MCEKAVIMHPSAIKEWSQRPQPPLPFPKIQEVLQRIEEVTHGLPPENVIIVEESPESQITGFVTLPQQVGLENSAVLFGARAGYCLKIAQEVLEDAGIPVRLDEKGILA